MNIYQDVENMLMEAFNAVLGPEDIIKIDQDLINVEPPRDKDMVTLQQMLQWFLRKSYQLIPEI